MVQSAKALVIDDDVLQRMRFCFHLEKYGFQNVYNANDGHEALSIIRKNNIDVIFCDLNMPGMDGVEFILKLSEININVRVLIVSAIDDDVSKVTLNVCRLLGFRNVDLLKKHELYINFDKAMARMVSKSDFIENSIVNRIPKLTFDEVIDSFRNGHVVNYYQPKSRFSDNKINSVEALVRIYHSKYGVLTPVSFIDCLEENDYMDILLFVVLENALSDFKDYNKDISISVNVTQNNLKIINICDKVVKLCDKYGYEYSNITLEITEHHAYENCPSILAELARFRIKGFKLSIDDFGTGCSSLEKLYMLPFNEIKIDKCFVNNLSEEPEKFYYIEMIKYLSDALGMNTVVEGVEDKETWELLKKIGFDECQGYLTGKPMKFEDFVLFYRDNNYV